MNSEEERSRQLLRGAAPDLGRLEANQVRDRRRRQRLVSFAAVVVAALAVAVIMITIPLINESGSPPVSSDPKKLAALTHRAPCPPPNKAPLATRAQLRAFHPVAAVTCHYANRNYPGDGRWNVMVRQGSSTDIADLAAAFDRPDQPLTSCASSMVGYGTAPLVLVDASGDYLILRYPENHCAAPARSATRAMNDHPWQTLSVRKREQIASNESRAAHCDFDWAAMFHSSKKPRSPDPGGPVFTRHSHTKLRACIYQTSAAHPPTSPAARWTPPSCALCA